MELRVGHGIDIHQFATGRKLFLGGVEIPHTRGLLGHSDADVLLHALCDAILGALAWGDIGQWFPDSQEKYKGADSSEFLKVIWEKARAEQWGLANCDLVLLAEEPRVSPYVQKIRESIAGLLETSVERVGLKATTTEKLGAIGRSEGVLASATVLLLKQ